MISVTTDLLLWAFTLRCQQLYLRWMLYNHHLQRWTAGEHIIYKAFASFPLLIIPAPQPRRPQPHPWCCFSISVFLLELLLSFISFLSLRYTTLTPSNVCPKRRCWHANIMLPGTDGGYTGNQQRETKRYHFPPQCSCCHGGPHLLLSCMQQAYHSRSLIVLHAHRYVLVAR